MSIGFNFICDKCHYNCFMTVHQSGDTSVLYFQCPHCKKHYEIKGEKV